MIYRSNLLCPDLTPHFKHLHSRVMPHSFGHDVPSDWADKADDDPVFGIYKRCGMWTHDEVAILYNVAKLTAYGFLDIGAHTGWTTSHLFKGGCHTEAVDPMLAVASFRHRFIQNTSRFDLDSNGKKRYHMRDIADYGMTSDEFFALEYPDRSAGFGLACIDGDHEPGKPLADAMNAAKIVHSPGVIIFHDFIGQPVREAVTWLMDHGFKSRVYFTPHGVACCWRGDLVPPDHVPDPEVKRQLLDGRLNDFDFTRCK